MTASEITGPGRLLEISGAYWQTCTLHAAVKLDLFTIIGSSGLTLEAASEKTGAPPRSLAMLLNALCAMGLLEKNQNIYANTPEADAFLSKNSPRYVGYMIMHHHHLVEGWSKLDLAVKTGKNVRESASFDEGEKRESFLMGMFNNAMGIAPHLAPLIDLAGRKHLLDLGGGPGTYAIHFCMHNPGLRATVFDLPTTRPFAEKTIARFNQQEAIDFQGGNFLEDPVQGRFDTVWLSHILHGDGPDDCDRIVRKAVNCLEPGGMIIIHDFILDDSRTSPLFPALFSLNMLLGTENGQSYSESELIGMLNRAGVTQIERFPYKGPTESAILIGRR